MATVIVIGLGAMGSSTAMHLAARGHHVVGFDQYAPPHTQGSSHGQTRMIRQAYWEDRRYLPMLLRAYELWRKLEHDSGHSLLQITGGLMIGHPDGDLVNRSRESAEAFRLPHELLSAAEARRRYPVFAIDDDMIALWEQNAGYLYPEPCVREQLRQAALLGVELHTDQLVLRWDVTPGGSVSVETEKQRYTADHLVITAGPWAPQVLREMDLPLQVTRQVLYWFAPEGGIEPFRADRMPVYLFESEAQQPMVYGFPLSGPDAEGVKVALHGSTDVCTPETVDRTVHDSEVQRMRERLSETVPSLAGQLVHAETCMYTMTPDEHFIIDKHPEHPEVTLAAGFSGHGFKFASVVGETLADLAMEGRSKFDLGLFSLARFRSDPST